MTNVVLKDVTKSFGKTEVIHGVDLEVQAGEFVVFVGPSGCGKSTLLRMIAGLEDISGGELVIGGRRMNDVPAAKRGVAMVFQSYALYPHLTVRQNMGFGLKVRKEPPEQIAAKVGQAADVLKIGPLLDRYPRELSGGQRQRVAIGRAIVAAPNVFLFDEPLSNLDAELRVHMRAEIASLHRRLGSTMIYVTHDQIEAMTLADRIVVLRNGHIEQVGSPRELYETPTNEFVAQFIGSPKMNIVEGSRVSAQLSRIGRDVPSNAKVGLRPEHLFLTDRDNGIISGTLVASEYSGSENLLHVEISDGSRVLVIADTDTTHAQGDEVNLGIEPGHVYVFSGSHLAG